MVPKILRSETTYRGRAFSVRRDEVRFPDGHETFYDIVDHAGAVALVPVDPSGKIWMVRQYRHSTAQVILELPAGTLEPGEPPEACAARECREEIGMAPGRLELLGEGFLAPGYSTEYMYFYLATDLSPSPLEGDQDEDLLVELVNPGQAQTMLASRDLVDVKTMAGLFLALPRLADMARRG